MSEPFDSPLITPAIFQAWRNEDDRLAQEENSLEARRMEIRARRKNLKQLMEAGQALMPEIANEKAWEKIATAFPRRNQTPQLSILESPAQNSEPQARMKHGTWTDTIYKIIEQSKGITHADIKEHLYATPLGEQLRRSESSFYGAIEKLHNNERIAKYKGRLYTPHALQEFLSAVHAGLEKDIEYTATGGQRSPTGEAIISFLKTHPTGAESTEIRGELCKNEEIKESITKHHSFLYNVLSSLEKKGIVRKEGSKYYAA